MSRVLFPLLFLGAWIAAASGTNTTNLSLDADPFAFEELQHETDTVPVEPRYGNFLTNPTRNPFDLNDPAAIEKNVEFDPESGQYIITEKIGDFFYRPPTYLTYEEYWDYIRKQQEKAYFDQLAGISFADGFSATDPLARIDVQSSLLDRLFGGSTIKIDPRGTIDLTLGVDFQRVENPILTERQRRTGGFDFDMNIQMNVTGQIGEKLNLGINYNTNATFDFDNQIKINYNSDQFSEDEIIKKIEAGNISFPLRGSLIQGTQSLFGFKTELQFGRLRLTGLISQQRSQRENIQIQGGSQLQQFAVKADQYDENRHFFFTFFNRKTFEPALDNLPQINSLFRVENLQVWITNDRNATEDVRDIVAFADLGEPEDLVNPGQINSTPVDFDITGQIPLPDNNANDLYPRLKANPDVSRIDRTVAILENEFGLQQTRDFERVSARRLDPSEFTFHPELGYISLNINVRPDQVLGVALEYSYNGKTYFIGDLANNVQNIGTDTTDFTPEVLYVKMLKSTVQRTDVPTWDLMMKNVYSLGAFQINRQDFMLDVFYEDPGEGEKRFFPENPAEAELGGFPWLRLLNLDILNVQGDPQPDGVFDFVPGVTINPTNGRVLFPLLEPFGSSLAEIIEPEFHDRYLFQELYDSTLFRAQEFQERNRYTIRGEYKSSVSSEISLGAFNIPRGSVQVTAGGQQLTEGIDFEVDYNIGRVRILNEAILNSGIPINVSYEDNTLFGFQNQTMFGIRADYEIDENFTIGGTYLRLFERPFTQKVNVGDDPINNRIYGVDLNLSREAPWLTKAVDAIPFISTKEPSSINVSAEAAFIQPGHSRAINQNGDDRGGLVYIDDFEGSANGFDIRIPVNRWALASVPQNDAMNNNPLFPESSENNNLVSGANRAKLSWYVVDPVARRGDDNQNPYTSEVPQIEVFPNLILTPDQLPNIQTLDLTFEPGARGPYNFDQPGGLDGFTQGVSFIGDSIILNAPQTRWGGIMRDLPNNDFQAANIEYVEFWMLSPFLDPNDPSLPNPDADRLEGSIYINLGNISEDILRDSRKFFENGLPGPTNPERRVDSTAWGLVPVTQQVVNAFDNDPASRAEQDLGLDGLNNENERVQFQDYVNSISAVNPPAGERVGQDPSNDDYRYYRDGIFTDEDGIFDRYFRFNNPEGNAPVNSGTTFTSAYTNFPDAEDLNNDFSLNEAEAYFQYEIPLTNLPGTRLIDESRTPFITDRQEADNGRVWYRFRIPLNTNQKRSVGGIVDFRSIRFMRMYMRGFETRTTLRFATLELVRNQWRDYTRRLTDKPLECTDATPGEFVIDAVNIEQNASREPFNYVLPLGIQREQTVGVFNALQNEQSLSLKVDCLQDSASVEVFKTINLDFRVYEQLRMFVHAEELFRNGVPDEVPDGGLTVFLRLGSDFTDNYYEYEIPLVMSDVENLAGLTAIDDEYKREVWRDENEFDFALKILTDLKLERNEAGAALGMEYSKLIDGRDPELQHRISVKGNPNLGFVKIAMIGIRNPFQGSQIDPTGAEVWVNEMRLSGLDERGGMAAIARMDMKLADFGTVTLAGNYSSIGFGAINQKVQERARESLFGFDFSTQLQLGKFFPQRWGINLPFFGQVSQSRSSPEFDPYDLDIILQDKLDAADPGQERDSIRQSAQDVTTIKSVNLTNVRKVRTNNNTKPKPWDIENVSVSYAYTNTEHRDPIIESSKQQRHTAVLDYNYSRQVTYIEPFKKIQGSALRWLSTLNINPLPNSFAFSTRMDRNRNITVYRNTDLPELFSTFYNKSFTWDRNYDLIWDLARSIKFNFNAVNNAVIDEPDEFEVRRFVEQNPNLGIDPDQFIRDSIWNNIRRFGRNKNYRHNFRVSWDIPIRYLPFLDWIQARALYQADYSWSAAALNVDSLGNVIQNSQNRQINLDFRFDQIYSKISLLRQIDQGARSNRRPNRNNSGNNENQGLSPAVRLLLRPFLMIRNLRFNFQEQFQTILPGYLPSSNILGLAPGWEAPGWGFVAGYQPRIRLLRTDEYNTDADWLFQAQQKGWLTESVYLNREVFQGYTQNWDGRLTLEPFNDLRIEFEMRKSFTENHTEFYKNFDPNGVDFQHQIPKQFGSMTITYSALNTLFQDSDTQIRQIFRDFENNRVVISQRLGTGVHSDSILAAQGYTFGYGRYQQDVIIPAFIAAYTQQDPNSVKLDIFDLFPRLNWTINYDGLSRIPGLDKIFQQFQINHNYRSTLTVNSFNTGIRYLNGIAEGDPNPVNPDNGNFFARLELPNVVINESFVPLVGINATLRNGMSISGEYKQLRTLALSIVGNQLTETRSKELIISFGYILRNVNLFNSGATQDGNNGQNPPQNRRQQQGTRDLNFDFNFSLRDDITFNHLLDQDVVEPTRGNYLLSISPTIEYQVSRDFSVRLFVTYQRSEPKVSTGFPRIDTAGGFVVRYQLQ